MTLLVYVYGAVALALLVGILALALLGAEKDDRGRVSEGYMQRKEWWLK